MELSAPTFPQNTLYTACADEKCTVQQVEELLKAGENPDQLFEGKETPLDAAVERKNLPKVQLLLKYGATATKYILTPVVKAMLQEDLLELQRLAKTDSDFKTGFCEFTPLRLSIALHDWDYFYLLLLKDIPPKTEDEIIELVISVEKLPFHFNWKTRFEFFLKYAEVTDYFRTFKGSLYMKEDMGAARRIYKCRSIRLLTRLLELLGYFQNKLKRMPSLLEVLKPNRHFRERTHLKSAIWNQDVNTVKFLLNQPEIDVNHPCDFPPLHSAIRTQNIEIINLLLSHKKLNINAEHSYRDTALICHFELKSELLDKVKDLEEKIKRKTLESKKTRTGWYKKEHSPPPPPPPQQPPQEPQNIVYSSSDEEEVEDEDDDDDLMAAVLTQRPHAVRPVARSINRSQMEWKSLYQIPDCKRKKQEILGNSHPDSEEAGVKLEAYWRIEIENEKQEIRKEISKIQKQIEDNSIELALKSHTNICLKPRIYFVPAYCAKTRIRRFGFPTTALVKGRELWIACFEGNLSQVESLLTEPNIDINYYLNVASGDYIGRNNNEGWVTPDMFKHNGLTSLHVACNLGFDRIVECLLQHPDIDINLPTLTYEMRLDATDDLYLCGGVNNHLTPLALSTNFTIYNMLINHNTFDVGRNLTWIENPSCYIPLDQIHSFFLKHASSLHVRVFCSLQLERIYQANKSRLLNNEELAIFKQLLDLGISLTYESIDKDDMNLVSMLLNDKPNLTIAAFQHFVRKKCNKSARNLANKFNWTQARNLCKNKRRMPYAEARNYLYACRVRTVEAWALKSLESSLNADTCSRISQFLFEF